MGRKKKSNTPRRKRMNQQARLQNARVWIQTYPGQSLVKGYAKRYGTDVLLALKELQMLGVVYSAEEIEKIKSREAQRIATIHERKRLRLEKERQNREAGRFWGYELLEQGVVEVEIDGKMVTIDYPVFIWQMVND